MKPKSVSVEPQPSCSKDYVPKPQSLNSRKDKTEILEKEYPYKEQDDRCQEANVGSGDKKEKTAKFNFSANRDRYSYAINEGLGQMIATLKNDAITEKDKKKVFSKAVREYFPNLKKAKCNDRAFLAAIQVARQSYKNYMNPSFEPPIKLKQAFCANGKSGPKVQAPEIRDQLYDWIVDIRSALKGRLPRSMFVAMAEQLQNKWIQGHPELAGNYKKVC